MTCYRCLGLMHYEALSNRWGWLWQLVCYNCANRIDAQILRNRRSQYPGRLAPRLLYWTPEEAKKLVHW